MVAGFPFGYGYFPIGVFAVGVSADTAFQTSGVVTVSTSVVA
ncbi:hypothetical protein [Halobaculum sp. MBLA0143]